MIPENSVLVRVGLKDTDKDFLYNSWLKSYKHNSYFAKRIRNSIFFPNHERIINHLISKPTVKVFITCPKNDEDTILGYLVCDTSTDDHVIHFVFVKDAFRRMGIMKEMLKEASINTKRIVFTHWTMPVDEIFKNNEDMVYDPYRL